MLSKTQIEQYKEIGAIVVPDVLTEDEVQRLRRVTDEFVERARAVTEHNEIYDLEDSHSAAEPRVRRIKTPHKVHPIFDEIVRSKPVIDILTKLIGPGLRLHGSKLNMKSAHYGSPVEWHQDWAFYPHTNDDVLAIGVEQDCSGAEGEMGMGEGGEQDRLSDFTSCPRKIP